MAAPMSESATTEENTTTGNTTETSLMTNRRYNEKWDDKHRTMTKNYEEYTLECDDTTEHTSSMTATETEVTEKNEKPPVKDYTIDYDIECDTEKDSYDKSTELSKTENATNEPIVTEEIKKIVTKTNRNQPIEIKRTTEAELSEYDCGAEATDLPLFEEKPCCNDILCLYSNANLTLCLNSECGEDCINHLILSSIVFYSTKIKHSLVLFECQEIFNKINPHYDDEKSIKFGENLLNDWYVINILANQSKESTSKYVVIMNEIMNRKPSFLMETNMTHYELVLNEIPNIHKFLLAVDTSYRYSRLNYLIRQLYHKLKDQSARKNVWENIYLVLQQLKGSSSFMIRVNKSDEIDVLLNAFLRFTVNATKNTLLEKTIIQSIIRSIYSNAENNINQLIRKSFQSKILPFWNSHPKNNNSMQKNQLTNSKESLSKSFERLGMNLHRPPNG